VCSVSTLPLHPNHKRMALSPFWLASVSRMKGLMNSANPRKGAVVRAVFSSSNAFWCCRSNRLEMSAPFFL